MDGVVTSPQSGGLSNKSVESVPAPSVKESLEELEKILSSQAFRNAESQRAFLRYVVEQSLRGCGDQIKEYTIGIDVFHRKESFDPRRDNTVRGKAQKLRWALAKYYQDEGTEDPVRIELPTGTYKPLFRFYAAPAQELSAQIPEAPLAEAPRNEDRLRVTSWEFQRRLATVLFAAVLLAASTAYLLKSRARTPAPTTPSIAVLPFRILNDAKEEDFFSDGLTEDLTDSLARMPGLRVVAASSAFQYKGKTVDVREIGRKLNVGVVLEGSVRRIENRVRVTTELSDTATGFHIWSSSYDREIKDVLEIQRQISAAITNSLGVTLSRPPHDIKQASATPDSGAYEDYLKGRYFWAKSTARDFDTAIGYFQHAIAKDPSYAPSYVGLAHCYAALPNYTSTTPKDTVPKIRENASKALALDGTLGEAHVDLARAYTYDYQWPMAEQEFRRALELSPGVAVVHQEYGRYLMRAGRFEEALAEFQKARNLNPVSPTANTAVARPLYFMHRYDEALRQYQQALELEPNSATIHEYIGMTYVMKGMRSQGIAEIEFAHGAVRDNVWYAGLLGWADAVDGRTTAAQQILGTLLERSSREASPAMAIANVYMGLGKKDKALEWLRRAFDSRNANLFLLKIDPIYDPLRSDPRFADLLRRMNLS